MCGDAIGNFVSKLTSPLGNIDPVSKAVSNKFKPSAGPGLGGIFANLLAQQQAAAAATPTPETQAALESQRQTLEVRRRMRRNSLLSMAGGAGDMTPAELATMTASGKPNLGG
jgi:hypothetical protein